MRFLGVLLGAMSTSVVFSVSLYFLSLNSTSLDGGNFISFSAADSAILLALVGAVIGLFIGAANSAIVIWYRLSLIGVTIFESIFYSVVSIALLLVTKESWTNDYLRYASFVLLAHGIIIGIIVSAINKSVISSE